MKLRWDAPTRHYQIFPLCCNSFVQDQQRRWGRIRVDHRTTMPTTIHMAIRSDLRMHFAKLLWQQLLLLLLLLQPPLLSCAGRLLEGTCRLKPATHPMAAKHDDVTSQHSRRPSPLVRDVRPLPSAGVPAALGCCRAGLVVMKIPNRGSEYLDPEAWKGRLSISATHDPKPTWR